MWPSKTLKRSLPHFKTLERSSSLLSLAIRLCINLCGVGLIVYEDAKRLKLWCLENGTNGSADHITTMRKRAEMAPILAAFTSVVSCTRLFVAWKNFVQRIRSRRIVRQLGVACMGTRVRVFVCLYIVLSVPALEARSVCNFWCKYKYSSRLHVKYEGHAPSCNIWDHHRVNKSKLGSTQYLACMKSIMCQ